MLTKPLAPTAPIRLVLALLVGVIALALLVFTLHPNQVADGATYYMEALLLSRGAIPFIDVAENKNPGFLLLLSLPARLGDWNPLAALICCRLVDLLNAVLIERLLAAKGCGLPARLLGALTFLIAIVSLYALGIGIPGSYSTIMSEPFQLAFGLLALNLVVRGSSPVVVGGIIGLSTLCRQLGFLDLVPVSAWLLCVSPSVRLRLYACMKLFLGFTLTVGAFCLWAWQSGWLQEWHYFAYHWNASYQAALAPFFDRVGIAFAVVKKAPTLIALFLSSLLWAAFTVGAVPQRDDRKQRWALVLLLFTLAHMTAATASGRVYFHHFIPLVAGLALLSGDALNLLMRSSSRLAPILSSAFLMWVALLQAPTVMRTAGVSALAAQSWEQRSPWSWIGEWARQHSEPQDRILVWGFQSEIYLAAERTPGSRFLHSLLLTNIDELFGPRDPVLLRAFDQDLRAHRPRYIFLLSKVDIHNYSAFIGECYQPRELVQDEQKVSYLELTCS